MDEESGTQTEPVVKPSRSKSKRPRVRLSPEEIEPRYQEHLKRIKGGK